MTVPIKPPILLCLVMIMMGTALLQPTPASSPVHPPHRLPAGMVNFHDPAVVAQDARALIKLWHTMCGLYIWEFFTTLDYEWGVIRGRLPYRWTIWIYSLTRTSTLLAVTVGLAFMNATAHINCQLSLSFALAFSFLSTAAASLLIVLRIVAIWNKNKVIVAIALSMWVINVGFLIQSLVRIRSAWVPSQRSCQPLNSDSPALNLIAMLITDIVLLFIMLVGLLRVRTSGGGTFGLTKFLWKQGVIWLLIALVAEVPPVVFFALDLNGAFDKMFQVPSWITMAIAAARIHRALVDFTTSSTEVFDTREGHRRKNSATKRIYSPSTLPSRMEVAVHTTFEQTWPSQTSDRDSGSSVIEQVHEKPDGLGPNGDPERGV